MNKKLEECIFNVNGRRDSTLSDYKTFSDVCKHLINDDYTERYDTNYYLVNLAISYRSCIGFIKDIALVESLDGLCLWIISEKGENKLRINGIYNEVTKCVERCKNEVNDTDYIYMECHADTSDRDWYGDFQYLSTPLDKYRSVSNLWKYKNISGSGRGNGYAGIKVKTTIEALEILGWDDDYEKYASSKERYEL